MTRSTLVVLLLVVTAFVGSADAVPSSHILRLPGPVSELAADGGRVAVLLRTKNANCTRDRVAVWGPAARTFVPIGASACTQSVGSGAGLFSVALAGKRVAYVQFTGGNARELQLRLAGLTRPQPVTVAGAGFRVDEAFGTYIGRVTGDGSLLAFDWWNECGPCLGANPAAPRSSVWRVVTAGAACPQWGGAGASSRCALVRSAPGRQRLLAVGGGLVALKTPDGGLLIASKTGIVRSTVAFAPGQLRAARIDSDGRTIVALVSSGGRNALEVRDPGGALRRTIPLPATKTAGEYPCGDPQGCLLPALRLEDLQSGVAIYVLGRDVHVVGLFGGRDAKIRVPGVGPVHAQIEKAGLFYSYQPAASRNRGRVAFVAFR